MAVDRDRVLGKTLAAVRESRGMTQEELGARVGIRRQAITRIEKSAEYCSIATLNRIARELEYPLWRIMRHAEKKARNT